MRAWLMRRAPWVLVMGLLTSPAAAEAPEVERLLNRYYDAQRQGDLDEVVASLEAILAIEPTHATAWRALGYHHQSQGRHTAAAEAFLAAAGEPPQHEMLMAAGYAYQADGREAAATHTFRQAAEGAVTSAAYAQACQARVYTAALMHRRLPSPWGLSVYSDTLYASRFDNTVTENRVRLRRYLDAERRSAVYGMLTYQDDWKSQVVDGIPEIYSDNYVGIGGGAEWWPHPAVRLYGELSYNRDLLARDGERRTGVDSRVGLDAFQAWGALRRCSLHGEWPLAPYGQAYASVQYPSRYENLLGQLTLWQGWRLYRHRMSEVSVYAKVNLLWDSEGLYYNNVIEAGPGLSWQPSLAWPVEIRLERLFGRYLRGEHDEGGYATTQLQLIVSFDI
ncbi:hypothetical protein [Halomonas sp. H5]|uniref:hypothetical protein n=1 Tax=Halomonas sp. H5 TaxID=3423910 RepID=UPI003D35AD15